MTATPARRVNNYLILQYAKLIFGLCQARRLPPSWSTSQRERMRPFPPPWSVEEQPACFVVRDHNGQALVYVYFEDEPGRRSAL
jgi:hypothetical protein